MIMTFLSIAIIVDDQHISAISAPRLNLAPRPLKAVLQFLPRHNHNRSIIATRQHNLLLTPSIQAVQTANDMRQVRDGAVIGIDLMKDVVARQEQHVAGTLLVPCRRVLVAAAVEDGHYLDHGAGDAAVFQLAVQCGVEVVGGAEGGVAGAEGVGGDGGKKVC